MSSHKRSTIDLTTSDDEPDVKEQTMTDAASSKRQKTITSVDETRVPTCRIVIFDEDIITRSEDISEVVLERLRALSSDEVVHLATSCDAPQIYHLYQRDDWSCGYQNVKVQLAALLPFLPPDHSYYRNQPYDPQLARVPTVATLQQQLLQIWRRGYDPDGAQHYRQGLARQWVGAVEAQNMLTEMGVDATCVQFVTCASSRQQLIPFCRAYFENRGSCVLCKGTSSDHMAREVLRSAERMASNACRRRSCSCPRLPLYLQWKGHSISVLGYNRKDDSLVVMDSRLMTALESSWRPVPGQDYQILLCSLHSFSSVEVEGRLSQLRVYTASLDAVRRARGLPTL